MTLQGALGFKWDAWGPYVIFVLIFVGLSNIQFHHPNSWNHLCGFSCHDEWQRMHLPNCLFHLCNTNIA